MNLVCGHSVIIHVSVVIVAVAVVVVVVFSDCVFWLFFMDVVLVVVDVC